MSGQELSDRIWAKMAHHLPGKATDPGRTGRDKRHFMEALLWLARTGAHWRALPDHFGKWNRIYVRFNRWCRFDAALSKDRNAIECFFRKIKHFRRIATRYDKPARNYISFVNLVGALKSGK